MYNFLGFDGVFIKKKHLSATEYIYQIEPQLEKASCGTLLYTDSALFFQVNKILPLAYYKSKIQQFIL